ncbi:MAG: hypothetical protein VX320_01855, partial [Candidatus Thermoplasmatota archaeon]|nr:hypothetical protein [Candidatus Thermoplasmatota archaeon]MEE3082819.1 hypothetical protein [Candidatus Thermoplasmatota archaeon]
MAHTQSVSNQYNQSEQGNDSSLDIQSESLTSSLANPTPLDSPMSFVHSAHFVDSKWPQQISVGNSHTCIVYDDGSLTCAGNSNYGKLGNTQITSGDTHEHIEVEFPEPVQIETVETGDQHTCAIDSQGRVWCWGYNNYRQVGVEEWGQFYQPVLVDIDANQTFVDIALGNAFTCAISASARLYCWGYNAQYVIPYTEINDYASPSTEIDLPSYISPVSLSAHANTACILNSDGAVYCWGIGGNGQLGDGTSENRNELVQVLLPSNDPAIAVETGGSHSCALLQSGAMKCWGYNQQGQLGIKTNTPGQIEFPITVQDLPLEPILITLGSYHTCAVLKNHQMKCWGQGSSGQLGYGSTAGWTAQQPDHRDVVYSNSGQNVPLSISTGTYSSCMITNQGRVDCWGANSNGMWGHGSTGSAQNPYTSPLPMIGATTQSLRFGEGVPHMKSPILNGMNVSVSIQPTLPNGFWLDNATGSITYDGQAIPGTTSHTMTFASGDDSITLDIEIGATNFSPYSGRIDSFLGGITFSSDSSISSIRTLSSSHDHTCISLEWGEMKCWGDETDYKLGSHVSTNDGLLPRILGYGGYSSYDFDAKSIHAAEEHTCAITIDEGIKCWGQEEFGRLGDQGQTSRTSGLNIDDVVFPTYRTVVSMDTRYQHNCAITDDGGVWCWGRNDHGQLGISNKNDYSYPQEISLPEGRYATEISTGNEFSCAILDNASIACWGLNIQGQLGDGTNTNYTNPNYVALTSGTQVETMSSGASHSCAIIANGSVLCWGRNNVGQLGIGTLTDVNVPTWAELPTGRSAVMIDAGTSHTCAVLDNGELYCWGLNADGQLGDGTTSYKFSPTQANLPSGRTAVLVTVGSSHTCILLDDSTLRCWGSNSDGQLGDGSTNTRSDMFTTSWNGGEETTRFNYALGVSSWRTPLIAGWGIDSTAASGLPTGFSLSTENGARINWNGEGIEGTDTLQFSATVGTNTISESIELHVIEHEGVEGRIPSFSMDSTFARQSLDARPMDVQVGYDYSCMLTDADDDRMKCWGRDTNGQLGYGYATTYRHISNVKDVNMGNPVAIDTGTYSTCAINEEAELWCWGENNYGQLGYTGHGNSGEPRLVEALEQQGVLQVSLGSSIGCALTGDWNVFCWGHNGGGQLGDGTTTNSAEPVKLVGLGDSHPTMVSTGNSVTCVLLENGSIGCVGSASYGEYGDGSFNSDQGSQMHWVQLPMGRTAISIDAANTHVCAILDDRSLACWGNNGYGQLGTGNATNEHQAIPRVVLNASHQVVGVSTYDQYTCAWTENGTAYCWGYNAYYQLGFGNNTQSLTPIEIGQSTTNDDGKRIVSMDAGARQTCALYDDYAVSCWGHNQQNYYTTGDWQYSTRYYPRQSYVQGYESMGSLTNSLRFIEEHPITYSILNQGWNQHVSFNTTLPSGLIFDADEWTLSYDGSAIVPGQIEIYDHATDTHQFIDYAVIDVHGKDGQVTTPWLSNASINNNYGRNQISMIDAGQLHTCMIEERDGMYCWGEGGNGQLGNANTANKHSPDRVYNSAEKNYSQISSGSTHTCAIEEDGTIWCWGIRNNYRLGDGVPSGSSTTPGRIHSSYEIYDLQAVSIT